jgi:hypothetical protein
MRGQQFPYAQNKVQHAACQSVHSSSAGPSHGATSLPRKQCSLSFLLLQPATHTFRTPHCLLVGLHGLQPPLKNNPTTPSEKEMCATPLSAHPPRGKAARGAGPRPPPAQCAVARRAEATRQHTAPQPPFWQQAQPACPVCQIQSPRLRSLGPAALAGPGCASWARLRSRPSPSANTPGWARTALNQGSCCAPWRRALSQRTPTGPGRRS